MAFTTISPQSLVRLRGQITKLQSSQAHLRGISTGITTAAATGKVSTSMAAAAKLMEQVVKVQNPQQVVHSMQQFQKENAKMDMASEMMDDVLDDVFEDGEEETDELVSQVLDEIGIETAAQLGSAPRKAVKNGKAAATQEDTEADELIARLTQLKA
jgi:division protein CdvB (Snf7/Vps24/ESCRT-III family)